MADGTGPGRITLSGVILAALILILIVASLYLFIAQPYWFPTLASEPAVFFGLIAVRNAAATQ